ncbi:MAG: DUF1549 domain-containing protein, partial [Verrucomicrobiae bacterium]|nr:DUF1549 domain-containing protein [Verrucomicrobiae bacterium]
MRSICLPFFAVFGVIGLSVAGFPAVGTGADSVEFNRDIRPILSDKCFHCHGPDAKGRKADLRLDKREGATADLGGYAAIVPGKSGDSELIARILESDSDEVMPPPETKKTLSEREVALLKAWIDAGAEYQDHWSLLPLSQAAPPAVGDGDWIRNPIDQFVLKKLSEATLAPSKEAEPATLIRRMSLDLTGLLPSPEEVSRFVTDYGADANAAVEALAKR